MAVDTSKLVAGVADLKAQAAKNSADIQAAIAKLGTIATDDPAVQAVVDSVVADLGAVTAGMQTDDAAVEAATA